MTEKQLYDFCRKEYNRFLKKKLKINKIEEEIEKNEGREKCVEFIAKNNVSRQVNFFTSCLLIFKGLRKNKVLIDESKTATKLKNIFFNLLEELISKYDKNASRDEFVEMLSCFGYEKNSFKTESDSVFSIFFNRDDVIMHIDKMVDYSQLKIIIDKFKDMINNYPIKKDDPDPISKILDKCFECLNEAIESLLHRFNIRRDKNDMYSWYEDKETMVYEYEWAMEFYDKLNQHLVLKRTNEIKKMCSK